ncbi:hypothetical protein [Christiangramia sabulilitoris]|uniref:Uncharacterized protein n=1 Tax=Christiangramia sabulilitoris TaxID=2583991 RepID=A0A550I976_9FLAO|nr:hypothetical protein [Christiangramia sabulilitoris]TRO67512.1 hypothetical protein FGM01_06410 [Christiangramia sabulilitoris]
MRLFLPQIDLSDHLETDFNIFGFLFKLILIGAIALLVFFLTDRSYHAKAFNDQGNATPEVLMAGPPVPY